VRKESAVATRHARRGIDAELNEERRIAGGLWRQKVDGVCGLEQVVAIVSEGVSAFASALVHPARAFATMP